MENNYILLSGAGAVVAGSFLLVWIKKIKSKLKKFILRSMGGKIEIP